MVEVTVVFLKHVSLEVGKCGFYFNRWDRTADVEVLPEPTIFGISRTNSEGDINRKT